MTIKITHILVLILLFQLLGCTTKNSFIKLDKPEEKIQIEGVSLLSPQGGGWYYKQPTPARLIFSKSGNNRDQTNTGRI